MISPTNIEKKLQMARQELLDLGLRNPLLNYRTLKARGLEIVKEKPAEVFRILVVDKKKMSFLEAFKEKTVENQQLLLPIVDPMLPEGEQESLMVNYTDLKLQTNYGEKQLESRLLNTYHSARTYIEEQGVNILYLALGMLHWYESDSSQDMRKAPLVLIPVSLDRVSARERFTITYTEDEIGSNISLIAKMKADFGIDIPQLTEGDDLDIKEYFSAVVNSIEGQKRWNVDTNALVVGFFSFGKFLMYWDLDIQNWPEHAKPEKHPIIKAVLEDGFNEPSSKINDEDHIDGHLNLLKSNHIMDADSSQVVAILDANDGRNMVIQGPPGTGKSQTITNLIADSIGNGKKVLFVSEKMAALEVVKRRLDSLGLGVACLELHSHKANKKTLLNELNNTLELGKPKYNNSKDIHLLEEFRTRLNNYSNAMNTEVGNSGVTPFRVLGELSRYQVSFNDINFPRITTKSMENWTAQEFSKRKALIEELQNVVKAIGIPADHIFWGCKKKVIIPFEIESIKQESIVAINVIKHLTDTCESYTRDFHYPQVRNMKDTMTFIEVCKRFVQAPNLKGVEVKSEQWLLQKENLKKLLEVGLRYKKIHEKYDAILIAEAWNQQLLDIRQPIVLNQDKWWRFLSTDYRKAKNKVLGLCKNKNDKELKLIDIVDIILEETRLKEEIKGFESVATQLFPLHWAGVNSNWEVISQLIQWSVAFHEDIQTNILPEWTLNFANYLPDKDRLLEAIKEIEERHREFEHTSNTLEQQLDFDTSVRFNNTKKLVDLDFTVLSSLISLWHDRTTQIHEIASFNNIANLCYEEQLKSFVELSEGWEKAPDYLLECFKWNWFQTLVSKVFNERKELSQFEGSRHEHTVNKFRELDRYLSYTNRFKLAEEHWKKLPQYEAGGQLGILKREFEKKTRHLPIRQLIFKAGHAIQAIKPVFMMSPLSIATYIQPGSIEFDLVIFDEASQVKPVDAFGAIIRAKQAIVVGDSKQMPPSNFFDSISKEVDGEDDNFVSDMESILGLFIGQNAPQRMLRWHYRSRHESLITVSNHEFYDNKLVVFPSPDADKNDSGLIYNYLQDTHYDRGNTRTNKLEAKAVAAAVIKHTKDHPNLTLGVAAFSMAQMQAILDELEMMRRANPASEAFFSKHPHEPFFVKNLENVQGDERDVIFISIGYGKTKEGYLAMDFGPLNRDGGERRLNVLITRARLRCEVFTNLKSDDIDLNRSNARGVKALKTFIKYAEMGNLDIPTETGKDFDSPFEEAVHKCLVQLGYDVKPQIGSAGFYVDLAVVDPESPGRFILGIECDGATYHSARSARDRDRLRQEVLEGLGWKFHRIWSTDWFRHPERELKRVVEAIEKATIERKLNSNLQESKKENKNEIRRESYLVETVQPQVAEYIMAELSCDLEGYEMHSLPISLLETWAFEVIKVESPVHKQEIMKRICDAAGVKRIGSRIQSVFEYVFDQLVQTGKIKIVGDFLWESGKNKAVIRNRSNFKTKKIDLISPEEIAEAVINVIKQSFGIEKENIPLMTCHLLGFSRVTEDMKMHVNTIVDDLILKDKIYLKGSIMVSN